MTKRNKLNFHELNMLNSYFEFDSKPSSIVISKLSEKIKLPAKSVQIWFQNKRAKRKREMKRCKMMRFSDNSKIFSTENFPLRKGISLLKTRIDIINNIQRYKFMDCTKDVASWSKNENNRD